ncbi:hypothetical protein [Oceanobacillus chungangensis]|uniref:hypothetical protein n=1 Tax=Oceanobacillus chungangensis TaxID=1229152 RepID=UPI001474D470|nr:hypothetical protein [Oceanobacillus chungangensis]
MRNVSWFPVYLFIFMMTVVGFLVFDNMTSSIIFGISVGGIFGWLFTSKKSRDDE